MFKPAPDQVTAFEPPERPNARRQSLAFSIRRRTTRARDALKPDARRRAETSPQQERRPEDRAAVDEQQGDRRIVFEIRRQLPRMFLEIIGGLIVARKDEANRRNAERAVGRDAGYGAVPA